MRRRRSKLTLKDLIILAQRKYEELKNPTLDTCSEMQRLGYKAVITNGVVVGWERSTP